jgi:hypothetical protein
MKPIATSVFLSAFAALVNAAQPARPPMPLFVDEQGKDVFRVCL